MELGRQDLLVTLVPLVYQEIWEQPESKDLKGAQEQSVHKVFKVLLGRLGPKVTQEIRGYSAELVILDSQEFRVEQVTPVALELLVSLAQSEQPVAPEQLD